ncbi:MAG: oligosaccharide flippase family protein [Candidatus Nanoarchaeia archaeon]|nr:oligosaccharide flippase family protein [Candidatus Nanoarchaeia archaeon]
MANKIINRIRKLSRTDIVRDNFILFFCLIIYNAIGYLFHFFAGRALGPGDYGTFTVLLSLLYLSNVVLTVIQTSITKFAAEFKDDKEKLAYLFVNSLRRLSFYGILLTIGFFIISPWIARFLKINSVWPVLISGTFLFLSFIVSVNRGILQGLQNFKKLGFSYIFEGLVKIVFGVGLILIGLGVEGGILAFVLSYIAAFLITLFPLRSLFSMRKIHFDTKQVYKYSYVVLVALTLLTLIYTVDVTLVKHFLDPLEAGMYGAMSLMGKIIFFGTLSVSMVMFPKSSELFESKGANKSILYKSLGLVLLFGIPVTLFYFLFPTLSVNLLFGSAYMEMASFLGIYGLVMTLFSLVYLISFYLLSIKQSKFIYILLGFVLVETALIWLFHSTIGVVAYIMLALMAALFLVMMLITVTTKDG